MQITISKEMARSTQKAIAVIGNAIADHKENGEVDHEKTKEKLKQLGFTPKEFYGLAKLVEQIGKKLNNNPKNKK